MAFPITLSLLNREDREQICRELEIRPDPPFSIGSSVTSSSVVTPFPFLIVNAEADEIRIPLFYAREMLGPDVAPGDDSCCGWKRLRKKYTPKVPYRTEQIPVVENAVAQLSQHSCTTIQVQPGAGKTIMATSIAVNLGYKYAVIVPQTPIVTQWVKTTAMVLFGDGGDVAKEAADKIICIPDQAAVERRKADKGKSRLVTDSSDFDVIISLPDRITELPDAVRNQIGTLIVDEAHLACVPSMVKTLLSFTPKHVIVLTATLEREDSAHRMMHLLAGNHDVFRKQTRSYRLIPFQTGITVDEKLNRGTGKLDYTALCGDIASNEVYNQCIIETVVQNPGRKFIILSKLVSHAEALCKALLERGVSASLMCGRRKECIDSRALVGTTNKVGTGFDVATFCKQFDGRSPDTLILAHTVKQWQSYAQISGRIMRASQDVTPVVVWMLTRNAVTSRHLSGLKKYIASTGGIIECKSVKPPSI